jgi:hypothetical protein
MSEPDHVRRPFTAEQHRTVAERLLEWASRLRAFARDVEQRYGNELGGASWIADRAVDSLLALSEPMRIEWQQDLGPASGADCPYPTAADLVEGKGRKGKSPGIGGSRG